MDLKGHRLPLSKDKKRSNPWRILAYILLILGGIQLTRMVEAGRVKPLLSGTPVPTRTARSYVEEGEAFFATGNLEAAIQAYRNAVDLEPENGILWAELARIQTYSSETRTNTQLRRERLAQARVSVDRAVEFAPDESFAHAIRALVYDWSATAEDSVTQRESFLAEAETSAVRANQLDPDDPLGLAFYAEVLTDSQKWAQARDIAEQAVARAEVQGQALGDLQMDVYRVYGTVLESLGLYRRAIEEYEKAVAVTPNLTFLYLKIGVNYRQLCRPGIVGCQELFDTALEYFNKAVQINNQINEDLRDQDPVPYLAIGKTYLQQGEFFAAALNIARALAINPADGDIYGRLGIVYYKARNYESAIPVLKCAVDGCSAEESQAILCELGYADCVTDGDPTSLVGEEVQGLELGSNSLEYYYTFGSALAFYSGTEEYPQGCRDAERVFQQLMNRYGQDPIVAGIVSENRAICARLGATSGSSPTEISPTSTPQP